MTAAPDYAKSAEPLTDYQIVAALVGAAFVWDDDAKRQAAYAIAAIALLIGARTAGGGPQGDPTIYHKLANHEQVKAFNRLVGDFVCGPIPMNPNVVDRLATAEASLTAANAALLSIAKADLCFSSTEQTAIDAARAALSPSGDRHAGAPVNFGAGQWHCACGTANHELRATCRNCGTKSETKHG